MASFACDKPARNLLKPLPDIAELFGEKEVSSFLLYMAGMQIAILCVLFLQEAFICHANTVKLKMVDAQC